MKNVTALVAALVAMLMLVPAAHAAATTCEGSMGPVVVQDLVVPAGASCMPAETTQVLGDVTVEANALLDASAVTIGGSVALASGSFFRISDSAIGGDVTCTRCNSVVILFMFDPNDGIGIDGDIRIMGMSGGHGHIEAGPIGGDIEVTDSSADFTFIGNGFGNLRFRNNVGNAGFWQMSARGNIEITGNTSVGGGFPADFTLFGNFAAHDLVFSRNHGVSDLSENFVLKDFECFKNDPAPVGFLNAAGKNIGGQCAELTGPYPE